MELHSCFVCYLIVFGIPPFGSQLCPRLSHLFELCHCTFLIYMKVFLSPYTFLQDTNVCTYRFTASHQFFQGDLLQDYTLSALIRTHCYSGKKNISMLFFFSFVVFICFCFYFVFYLTNKASYLAMETCCCTIV